MIDTELTFFIRKSALWLGFALVCFVIGAVRYIVSLFLLLIILFPTTNVYALPLCPTLNNLGYRYEPGDTYYAFNWISYPTEEAALEAQGLSPYSDTGTRLISWLHWGNGSIIYTHSEGRLGADEINFPYGVMSFVDTHQPGQDGMSSEITFTWHIACENPPPPCETPVDTDSDGLTDECDVAPNDASVGVTRYLVGEQGEYSADGSLVKIGSFVTWLPPDQYRQLSESERVPYTHFVGGNPYETYPDFVPTGNMEFVYDLTTTHIFDTVTGTPDPIECVECKIGSELFDKSAFSQYGSYTPGSGGGGLGLSDKTIPCNPATTVDCVACDPATDPTCPPEGGKLVLPPDQTTFGDVYGSDQTFDFGARLQQFFTELKETSLFSLPGAALSNVPGGGNPVYSFNGGETFGEQSIDLSSVFSGVLIVMRSFLILLSSFVAVRIVILKR